MLHCTRSVIAFAGFIAFVAAAIGNVVDDDDNEDDGGGYDL